MNGQFYNQSTNSIAVVNLVCQEVKEKHTADNIREWVKCTMDKFGIHEDQLLGISIDSAANVTKAVDDLIATIVKPAFDSLSTEVVEVEENIDRIEVGLSEVDGLSENELSERLLAGYDIFPDSCIRIHCVAHRFQLGVCDFIKDREISNILNRIAKLSAKLRTPLVRRLANAEIGNFKQPVMSQATRWSSNFFMIERVLPYENFCNKYGNDKELKNLKVDPEQWNVFRDLLSVFKPSQVFTSQIQAQNLTVTECLYSWFVMKAELNHLMNSTLGNLSRFASKLVGYIEARENDILNNKIMLAGWFLGQKLKFTMSPNQVEEAKSVIKMVVMKKFKLVHPEENDKESEVAADPEEDLQSEIENLTPVEKTIFDAMAKAKNLFTSRSSQTSVDPSQQQDPSELLRSLEKEFYSYEENILTDQKIPFKPDSLSYWKEKITAFPILANAALDIISAPMTEVTVERLFSHLNFILTDRRNRIKADIIEDILFLRLNKRYLD